jgi:O-antigen/teichoic acid export membrane protein
VPAAPAPSLLQATLSTLLLRALLLPVSLLQGSVLARALGPAGLGLYSAALVDVNLLVALLSLGLPGGLALVAGEARQHSDQPQRIRALRRLALRHGGVLLLATLSAVPLYLSLSRVVTLPARSLAVLSVCACLVVAQFARDVQNALLWGGQRFAAQNRINGGVQIALGAALLVLWFLGLLRAETALLLQLASHILWIVLSRLAFWAAARLPVPTAPLPLLAVEEPAATAAEQLARSVAQRARQIGLRSYIGVLLDLLLLRIDVYLIERLVPASAMAHELGLYQAGVRIAELILFVPSTLNAVLFAKAAAREAVVLSTLRAAKLALWLGVVALVGMWLVGQPLLVLIFGARFSGSFVPCLWILAGCAATCFASPLAGTLSGEHGYPRAILLAQLAALGVNIGANWVLLPRWGIVGAAMASTAAYVVSAVLIASSFAHRYRVPFRQLVKPEAPWTLWRSLRAAPSA